MLPSPPCYLVYKSLWERTVSHPAEVQQLLPQKGSIIVWRAQSVSALQTGIKKNPQPSPNPRTLPVSSCQPSVPSCCEITRWKEETSLAAGYVPFCRVRASTQETFQAVSGRCQERRTCLSCRRNCNPFRSPTQPSTNPPRM